jgi:purine-binding chemotaxis protein CheW
MNPTDALLLPAHQEATLDEILAACHSVAPGEPARTDLGYAQPVVDVDEVTVKLVLFSLAGQHFALPGERIREIRAQTQVYFIPGADASLEGVINVRGDIQTVLLLHRLLGLAPPPGNAPGKKRAGSLILIARGSEMESGLRVDEVIDVLDVPQNRIQAPPDTLPPHLRPHVSGLLDFNGQSVAILDLDRLFAAYLQGQG